MDKRLQTSQVFIDTEVFINANFQFSSGRLSRLYTEPFSTSHLFIAISDHYAQERSHLATNAKPRSYKKRYGVTKTIIGIEVD
ncbi:MAG: hypothetical protein V7K27_25200 [Nostoc sp.]|uniref:hypothetical protein n=1 Tax=Nostoc sp. TaxID=1180 RepID=UPI002FFB47E6